jgi:hypothetical protein
MVALGLGCVAAQTVSGTAPSVKPRDGGREMGALRQGLSRSGSGGIVARARCEEGVAVSTSRRCSLAIALVAALLSGSVGASLGMARGWLPVARALAFSSRTTYFAGRSYPEAGAASVTTEFVVPTLVCTSTNTGVASGAFLYTTAGSPRHGSSRQTDLSAASVQLFCLHGEPEPLPVVEVEGRQTYGSVRPHIGDLMRVTVIDSPRKLVVALQDLTRDHEFTLAKSTAAATATVASIGDDVLAGVPSLTPGPVYPITNFGSIHFIAGRINGKLLGAAGGKAFDMVNSRRVLQVKTGPLTGGRSAKRRDGFVTTWKHS